MERKIVAVNGLIGSGKDTFSKHFIDAGYVRCSFAESLKDAVSVIFGWERSLLEGDTDESREYREIKDEFWTNRLDFGIDITPRWILQNFGTNAVRKHFHNNIWLFSLENKIIQNDWEKVIITDCRFPNELALIRQNNGTIIEVQRGEQPNWYDVAAGYNLFGADVKPSILEGIHESEWAWIGINQPNYVVKNDSTLMDLQHEAYKILVRI